MAGKYNDYVKKDHRKDLNDRLLERMESSAQYQTPWISIEGLPYNPLTQTRYRGINFLSLATTGEADSRWFTFVGVKKVAEETGQKVHVRKNESGRPVFHPVDVKLASKDVQLNDDGTVREPGSIKVMAFMANVFNASQIEGSEHLPREIKRLVEPLPALQKVIAAMEMDGMKFQYAETERAFYNPHTDTVTIPFADHFKSDLLAARTTLHEIFHGTGHPKRLNRETLKNYGESIQTRADEELVAEIGSYYMGSELNLPYDPGTHDNHAGYVRHWMQHAKDDKNSIFRAAAQADKGVQYVQGMVQKLEQKLAQEQSIEPKTSIILPPEKTLILPPSMSERVKSIVKIEKKVSLTV